MIEGYGTPEGVVNGWMQISDCGEGENCCFDCELKEKYLQGLDKGWRKDSDDSDQAKDSDNFDPFPQ